MSSDGGLRPLFRENLRSGWHWQSVETPMTGSGVPDSNWCCCGMEGWVEFKQTASRAVTLRTEQVGWLLRRHHVGGRVHIAVRRRHDGGPRKGDAVDELWLLRGSMAREAREHGLIIESPWVLGVWGDGPSRWDWEHVGRVLIGDSR